MAGLPGVARLSSEGWDLDPIGILNAVYSHMFVTNYSQSNEFKGTILSIKYLVSQYGDNPQEFASQFNRKLKETLERYFDTVQVIVEIQDDEQDIAEYTVKVSALVTRGDAEYSLSRAVLISPSSGTAKLKQLLTNGAQL